MDYKIVFDIFTEGYKSFIFVIFGILFILIGYFLQLNTKHKVKNISQKMKVWFANFYFWGSLLITVLLFLMLLVSYIIGCYLLMTEKYEVVEGIVTDFIPMPYSGHSYESFVVNGKRFSYSQYSMGPEFHHTKSHGGPIDQGVQVRISYINNKILRLEIAK
ncbi:membrane protein [Beggiatoa sp. PS]|nr:membrane protein [Beggiatoa sp. PS]